MAEDPAQYETQALQAERESRNLRARIGVRAAYRRLFTGHDGELKDDAVTVLGDIARQARLGQHRPLASNEELRERATMRALVLHIFARLDPKALAKLSDNLNGRTER